MSNGTHPQVRQGVGRRKEDESCALHEERLDDMETDIAKQSGWLKASAGLVTAVSIAVSILCTVIIGKLGNIETLLSDSKVVLMQHSEQIKSIDSRVHDIEERHKKDVEEAWSRK